MSEKIAVVFGRGTSSRSTGYKIKYPTRVYIAMCDKGDDSRPVIPRRATVLDQYFFVYESLNATRRLDSTLRLFETVADLINSGGADFFSARKLLKFFEARQQRSDLHKFFSEKISSGESMEGIIREASMWCPEILELVKSGQLGGLKSRGRALEMELGL